MPGVFVLVMFPSMLLGAVLVSLGLDLSGGAAVSMALLVMLVGVVFVSLAMAMRRQHPSHQGGDRRLSQDDFARLRDALERQAVPEEISDQETGRFGDLDRWRDDGGYRSPPAESR